MLVGRLKLKHVTFFLELEVGTRRTVVQKKSSSLLLSFGARKARTSDSGSETKEGGKKIGGARARWPRTKKGTGESSDDEKVLVLLVQEHETDTSASKCRRKL